MADKVVTFVPKGSKPKQDVSDDMQPDAWADARLHFDSDVPYGYAKACMIAKRSQYPQLLTEEKIVEILKCTGYEDAKI